MDLSVTYVAAYLLNGAMGCPQQVACALDTVLSDIVLERDSRRLAEESARMRAARANLVGGQRERQIVPVETVVDESYQPLPAFLRCAADRSGSDRVVEERDRIVLCGGADSSATTTLIGLAGHRPHPCQQNSTPKGRC